MFKIIIVLLSSFLSINADFFQLTDIHVDLDQECTDNTTHLYGNFDNSHYGCGASSISVLDTSKFMHKIAPNIDFIIFTGDAPWSGGVLPTMESIQQSLSSIFPNTPLYFLMGNHDFTGKPFGTDATELYPKVANLWGKWLDDAAHAEFSTFGYYSLLLPNKSLPSLLLSKPVRLIALNTEHFNHGNSWVTLGKTWQEGQAQLLWLNQTLTNATLNNETCWLFGHVPPGMECGYLNDQSKTEASSYDTVRENWMPIWQMQYQKIIELHASNIGLQSFGHEHVDTFRLVGSNSVLFSVPSLSTGYPATNPTTRLWHTNKLKGTVHDYTQYHMDLINSNLNKKPIWNKSYTASEVYNLTDLTRNSMEMLLERFHSNSSSIYSKERRFFMSSTPVKYQPKCDAWCQTVDLCDKEFGADISTDKGFQGCTYWRGRNLIGKNNYEL